LAQSGIGPVCIWPCTSCTLLCGHETSCHLNSAVINLSTQNNYDTFDYDHDYNYDYDYYYGRDNDNDNDSGFELDCDKEVDWIMLITTP